MKYSAQKVTVNKIRKAMPFLNALMDRTRWKKTARVSVRVYVNEQVELGGTGHDATCRYTSQGVIEDGVQKISAHFAGTYDSCLNNVQEMLGKGIDGKYVKGDAFYAVADSLDYYRVRELDVYVGVKDYRQIEVAKLQLELKESETLT